MNLMQPMVMVAVSNKIKTLQKENKDDKMFRFGEAALS